MGNPLDRYKIIVVDDSDSMLVLIKETLKAIGFKYVYVTNNGPDALIIIRNAYSTKPYSLVLCDWNMPGYDGIDVLEELRNDPRTQKLPFIMLTSVKNESSILEAVNKGVSGYIIKPFTIDSLKTRIFNLIKKNQQ